MVTELSATFVARMIFGLGRRLDGEVLFVGRLIAMQGQQAPAVSSARVEPQAVWTRRISAAPGRKTSTCPSSFCALLFAEYRSDLLLQRLAECGVYSMARGYCRPSERMTRASPRYAAIGRGIERRGHDDQPQVRTFGKLQTAQEREREIAFEVTFMEFVEHHDGHAIERGVREQPRASRRLR